MSNIRSCNKCKGFRDILVNKLQPIIALRKSQTSCVRDILYEIYMCTWIQFVHNFVCMHAFMYVRMHVGL